MGRDRFAADGLSDHHRVTQLGVGFGMVRKRVKLPGSVVAHTYSLEYGMDSIEISADLIPAGSRGTRASSR